MRTAPWVVVANYPSWPSPYFAQLQRHADGFPLQFATDLDSIDQRPQPGVINLHRLKRLYRDTQGRRTTAAARLFLARLDELRAQGWRLVWTVHNLLPIDGAAPGPTDEQVTQGVLDRADAILAHTQADAAVLRTRTQAPVAVTGWGSGPPAPPDPHPPSEIRTLAEQIRQAPVSLLLLGNLAAYKGIAEVFRAFTTHTRQAELFVLGTTGSTAEDRQLVRHTSANPRVHPHLGRVAAQHTTTLFHAAQAAVCPYRTDGPWHSFTQVCRPASVLTARATGRVVCAPDLPAIREITHGWPRQLYSPDDGPGSGLAELETGLAAGTLAPVADDATTGSWTQVLTHYRLLAAQLLPTTPL